MNNTNYSSIHYRENISNITNIKRKPKEVDQSDYHAVIASILGFQCNRNITEKELIQAKLKKMAVSRIIDT